ncbi:secretion-regulating guanine nucleotide exchange factor-like isoform X2 [Anser cygnoides]|uniref:secretion-regulating guanine nucleotide exchange factor-like isoform X2 n=1 Tax=Anser cygnoides TaxID=8845 RepID=UPI0034D1AD00
MAAGPTAAVLFAWVGAGELFVCGHNKEGQLGLNHTEDVLRFTLCTALSGFHVKEVACGWDFAIIVGIGLVLSCGSNAFGQLEVPQISGPCLTPQKIENSKGHSRKGHKARPKYHFSRD